VNKKDSDKVLNTFTMLNLPLRKATDANIVTL